MVYSVNFVLLKEQLAPLSPQEKLELARFFWIFRLSAVVWRGIVNPICF
jgi:hypothetical protein